MVLRTGGAKPGFYLDSFEIEETGGSEEYSVSANLGTQFHINKFTVSIADTGTGGTAFAYDQIGALSTLPNGIILRLTSKGKTVFSANIKQLCDFLDIGMTIDNKVDDGTNTYANLSFRFEDAKEIILDSREDDTFSLTIADNLSGLLVFKAFANGWEELL